MSPRQAALAFLEAFAAPDLAALGRLLHPALGFRGPFFAAETAAAYLAALEADPPEPATVEVLAVFEQPGEACVIYRYAKPGLAVEMAQWFVVEGGQIRKIRLFFDGRAFDE